MGEESRIQQRIRCALTEVGTFTRINAGQGWTGKMRREGRTVIISNARPLHAAPAGYPDITGWVPVEITPEMVGSTVALYCAVEVKSPKGRLSKQQAAFLRRLDGDGGVSIVARSEEDLQCLREMSTKTRGK